jgi:hypothetical protein
MMRSSGNMSRSLVTAYAVILAAFVIALAFRHHF